MARPADRLEADGIGKDLLEHAVVIYWLVVTTKETPYARRLRPLHRDDVARSAPILLDRDRVAERIHYIEGQQVGVSVKLDERVGFVELGALVLTVGRVDDRLPALGKAIP